MKKTAFTVATFVLMSPLIVEAVTKATCGDPIPCSFSDLSVQLKFGYFLFLAVCSVLLMKVWVVEIPKYALSGDNAGQRATSRTNIVWAGIAFVIIGMLPVIVYAILQGIGVKDQNIAPIKNIQGVNFFQHAYAVSSPLYQATDVGDNPVGFVTTVTRVAMRWLVYPILLGVWVWSAFLLIAARGNPTELSRAKTWLLGSLIATLMLFLAQMTFIALTATVSGFFN
jgi:hypothetical protein